MAQLLTALNIPQEKQDRLVEDVFVAEELVIALQQFYERMDDGMPKDNLEKGIIEVIGDILTEANQTK
jgi:hypothetical protein